MLTVKFKMWIPQVWVHLNGEETNTRQPHEGEGINQVKHKQGTARFQEEYATSGVFHRWADEVEEDDRGFYQSTYGIVELSDGTIQHVLPKNIKFIHPKN